MALWDQAASVHASNFDPSAFAILFERVVKGMRGLGPPDEAGLVYHTDVLNRKLQGYERLLGRSRVRSCPEREPFLYCD
jgi:glutathione S-transferase